LKRNENDAAALQAKVAAKQSAVVTAAATAPSNGPIVPKKINKKPDSGLDDLLSAGLNGTAGKKKAVSAK
jgi:hypothetical protein